MPAVTDIIAHLDEFLDTTAVPDSSWNGLQVAGSPEVTKVVSAVDASRKTFEQAAAAQANLILAHHGLFWQHANPTVSGWQKDRIDLLLQNEISLYTSHLPLDRHPEVGNNALLLRLLDIEPTEEFYEEDGVTISWIGEAKTPHSFDQIVATLETELNAKCRTLPFGPKEIKRVAVATGGGSYRGFNEALAKNADLYITGDTAELYASAQDAHLNVIFAGHYATETLGVRALGDHLAQKFSISHEFIDIPTGL